ncbi:hypothetical protein A2833_02515 [Candidatus Azambacteria bacterium RIFCSPHIGHO2_01_FULL_44_55]|uniref:Methyltransferase FkbM domain-containing protein n=1 Tax=Candidatus Azambacteria bacterium RIFCSPLOWO2_02_FULL_44_14 TaxID=1797306 RepID=A0A1F5CD09_9BACT|nr:MAG: hypothetical protein A3A18_01190 [Candidatus Azambacteria bacterium RIFCSPLOWO2_01_FULL_44_84]OGD33321.1 MAG: hypothetical protein A3C78_02080 [Candidatus Azambacteria bacterium RIFCSPHIGHO2_02_FULL_45_18]OGD40646.1 MAG: hypothetical protein A2833_02515 [Candidatus Azambacteria bacterium RIFCSPHIGHO2_01_FULL_44_55]OGD40748.1 MAG: hypothetical protein A3I30_01595 [Candidatus Azambacteria bacterium RIFCSPLOWO2_02_FULL_44_14]OGD49589.1 MAG: hypothetical protein A2608_01380 [Candidatus Azam
MAGVENKNLTATVSCIKNSGEFKKLAIFTPDSFWRKVLQRKIAIVAWLEGAMSFKNAVFYILPHKLTSRNSVKHDAMAKYINLKLKKIVEKSGLDIESADVPYGPSELINLLEMVIVKDQYRARDFIKNDSIIIDAGANVGVFSVFAGSLADSGQVFAFEPVLRTYQTLVKNVQKRHNIVALHSALGAKTGTADVVISDKISGGNYLADSEKNSKTKPSNLFKKELTAVTTIDEFVESRKLSRVDFIKIDAESYEKQIIKGAKETIKKFKPVLALSAYHLKDDKDKIPALVASIDPAYNYELSCRCEEVFIFRRAWSVGFEQNQLSGTNLGKIQGARSDVCQ